MDKAKGKGYLYRYKGDVMGMGQVWARPRGRGSYIKVQEYAMDMGQVWSRPRGRGTHIGTGGCNGHGPGMGKAKRKGVLIVTPLILRYKMM